MLTINGAVVTEKIRNNCTRVKWVCSYICSIFLLKKQSQITKKENTYVEKYVYGQMYASCYFHEWWFCWDTEEALPLKINNRKFLCLQCQLFWKSKTDGEKETFREQVADCQFSKNIIQKQWYKCEQWPKSWILKRPLINSGTIHLLSNSFHLGLGEDNIPLNVLQAH